MLIFVFWWIFILPPRYELNWIINFVHDLEASVSVKDLNNLDLISIF